MNKILPPILLSLTFNLGLALFAQDQQTSTQNSSTPIHITFSPINGLSPFRVKAPFSAEGSDVYQLLGDSLIALRCPKGKNYLLYQDLNNNNTFDEGEPISEFGKQICLKYQVNGKEYPYWLNIECSIGENKILVSSNTMGEGKIDEKTTIKVADTNLDGKFGHQDYYELNNNGSWLPVEKEIIINQQLFKLSFSDHGYAWNLTPVNEKLSQIFINTENKNIRAFMTLKNTQTNLTIRVGSHGYTTLPAGEYVIVASQFHLNYNSSEIAFMGNYESKNKIIIKTDEKQNLDFKVPTKLDFNFSRNAKGGYIVSHPVLIGNLGESYLPVPLNVPISARLQYLPQAFTVDNEGNEKHILTLTPG